MVETLVLGITILTAIIAFLGPRIKVLQKRWRSIHIGLGFILLLLLIIHIKWRNLI